MARIIGGSMIGELSGKMGGIIFSRNKSGPYMKQYVIPVDPKSQAQIDARAAFGIAAANWHSLESNFKVGWQNFAQNHFLPKIGSNTGQFSGFNAWTALNNTVINANSKLYIPGGAGITISSDLGVITPADIDTFNTVIVAPVNNPTGAWQATGFQSATMQVLDASLRDDFAWMVQVNAGGGTGPTPGIIPAMVDSGGSPFGIAAYMSNPVSQEQDFINNPYLVHLGTIAPALEFGGVGAEANEWVRFTTTAARINESEYQSLPEVGDWVRLSFFEVTTQGQMLKIGAKTVQIAA